jgi:hypothetical protein
MEIRLKNNGSAAKELVGCQVNYALAESHPIMQLPQPSPVPVPAAVGDFLAPFVVEPSLQHAAEQVNQEDGSDITLFVGFPVRPLVLAKLPDLSSNGWVMVSYFNGALR